MTELPWKQYKADTSMKIRTEMLKGREKETRRQEGVREVA